MKKYLMIPILLLLLTGCKFYDEYKMPEEVNIELNENKFEVYSENTVEDLISDTNVEITNLDKKLVNKELGEKEIEIEYKYKKRSYKYVVTYETVDTEAPFVIKLPTYRATLVNEEIDFCEGGSFIDNYDRELTCSITGDYDITVPNRYYLKYEIKDDSGNITNKDLTFDVLEYYNEYTYNGDDNHEYTYTLFDDLQEKYKGQDVMLGIDVSVWQGDIDFNQVKADGAEFVIIRMAYSDTDTPIVLDTKFEQNLKRAKDAGLKVGVYVYTSANTKEEAIEQAKFIKKHLNKTKLDFPIVYDFEEWSTFNELKMNSHDLLERVNEYKSVLEKDGYDMMIYGSKYYLENVWLPNNYDIWLAHYIDETNYKGDYILWQLCSDGIIDGINGYVDFDIYYKK